MTDKTALAQASAVPAAMASGIGMEPMISLGLGLLGVVLARIAFTTRQQRLGENVSFVETAVITCMAMLIVGPIVWEHELGMTTSALVGLGAGWSSIAIFDALGERAIDFVTKLAGGTPKARPDPAPPNTPPISSLGGVVDPMIPAEMVEQLERIDQAEDRQAHAAARAQRRGETA